jgi:hypothetical protein
MRAAGLGLRREASYFTRFPEPLEDHFDAKGGLRRLPGVTIEAGALDLASSARNPCGVEGWRPAR